MADYIGDLSLGDQELAISVADLLGKTVEAGGKKYVYLRAGASITKNTPYSMQHEGGTGATTTLSDPCAKALLNTAVKQLVVVPVFRSIADNDTGWFQFQGPCTMTVASATYTAGRALKVDAGVATEIAAAPTNGDNEFASIMVGGTTVTSITAFLFGREALTET